MSGAFLSSQKTTLRFVVIGLIVLAMVIPLAMVEGVTEERQSFFDMTLLDIAKSWGSAQNITGPLLVIPEVHRYQVKNDEDELVWRERTYHRAHLPARLNLAADVQHQFRKRSIYEVPVYSAVVKFEGEFPALDSAYLSRPNVNVRLDQSRIVVGISHTQAISMASVLSLGEIEVPFRSGTGQAWIGTGVHALVDGYPGEQAQTFQFELQLKGTQQLGFTPVGDSTEVTMTSSWPHPSFNGSYLPEDYQINEEGFSARWVVHELARDLPRSWRVDREDIKLDQSYAWISLFSTGHRVHDRRPRHKIRAAVHRPDVPRVRLLRAQHHLALSSGSVRRDRNGPGVVLPGAIVPFRAPGFWPFLPHRHDLADRVGQLVCVGDDRRGEPVGMDGRHCGGALWHPVRASEARGVRFAGRDSGPVCGVNSVDGDHQRLDGSQRRAGERAMTDRSVKSWQDASLDKVGQPVAETLLGIAGLVETGLPDLHRAHEG